MTDLGRLSLVIATAAGLFACVPTTNGAPPPGSTAGATVASFGATPVTTSTSGQAAEVAKRLVDREIKKYALPDMKPEVFAGFVNVGEGDKKGLLVQIRGGGWCGTAGCPTKVFRNINGKWVAALDNVGTDEIAVLPGKVPADLILTAKNSALWQFDGKAYHFARRLD